MKKLFFLLPQIKLYINFTVKIAPGESPTTSDLDETVCYSDESDWESFFEDVTSSDDDDDDDDDDQHHALSNYLNFYKFTNEKLILNMYR